MKRHILLADGPDQPLRALEPDLARSDRWQCTLVQGGLRALAQLSEGSFDAAVVDLHLEDMTGLQLADEIRRRLPQLHRIILADLQDSETLLRCVGNVHQFLAKPCSAGRLRLTLERAFSYEVWLSSQNVRPLVGRLPRLPSPVRPYAAAVKELERDPPEPERLAPLIVHDPPMAARILQVANSAAPGDLKDEADPERAMRELGWQHTRAVLLLAHTYSDFAAIADPATCIRDLWRHAGQSQWLARRIAETCRLPEPGPAQAATAGLLHDLGKVALAANLPRQFDEARRAAEDRKVPGWEAEETVFGAHHGEVAAWLLALWNLPPGVVEAVALHHHPARFLHDDFSPLTAVHLADALLNGPNLERAKKRLDRDYLEAVGVWHRLAEFWTLTEEARSIAQSESPHGTDPI